MCDESISELIRCIARSEIEYHCEEAIREACNIVTEREGHHLAEFRKELCSQVKKEISLWVSTGILPRLITREQNEQYFSECPKGGE